MAVFHRLEAGAKEIMVTGTTTGTVAIFLSGTPIIAIISIKQMPR